MDVDELAYGVPVLFEASPICDSVPLDVVPAPSFREGSEISGALDEGGSLISANRRTRECRNRGRANLDALVESIVQVLHTECRHNLTPHVARV